LAGWGLASTALTGLRQGASTAARRVVIRTMADAEPKAAIPNVVFVLGGPGAGKGTQCARLVADHGFVHLSAGDLLRAERKSGTATAQRIQDIIARGEMVPGEITTALLHAAMSKQLAENGKKFFLVDGFPRNDDNCFHWDQVVGEAADVKMVLVLECDMEQCTERVLQRAREAAEGAKRADDNVAVLQKRFQTYVNDTRPVIERYRAKSLVEEIKANRGVDEVYADVVAAVKKRVFD